MQISILTFGQDDPAHAIGAIVAGAPDFPAPYNKMLRKGSLLRDDDLTALRELASAQPGLQISLLRLDQTDVDENSASVRLGAAIGGAGIEVRGPSQGRVRLHSRHAGLLVLDRDRLALVNSVPDVSIYSLFNHTPVAASTIVAEAKITPLATEGAHIESAEQLAKGAAPLLDVVPFKPRKAGLLIRERLEGQAASRVSEVVSKKLEWFGSSLIPAGVQQSQPDAEAVAELLNGFLASGADLLITAGGSASNPHDATLQALRLIGAEAPRIGIPIHPGSLFWLAWKGDVPIVGVPSCGAFSEHTSFDIVLPRLLALGRNALVDIDTLGEGGLLTRGMEYRFPRYEES